MPFVKLDCGILNSTLWIDRYARELFITALLMAEPFELTESTPQIEPRSLDLTGWEVPPGWYGFVPAAGVGIIDRAKIEQEFGMLALERLGSPEPDSRSSEFEGRRLVRINGGYLVLNFMRYRDRDYTTAERSKRYRERLKSRRVKSLSRRDDTPIDTRTTQPSRDITQAEAEAEIIQEQKTTIARVETPTRGKQHGRIFLHRWQLESLIDTLGPHAEAFGLDAWVGGLTALADGQGVTLPKARVWDWVQAELVKEIQARGLPIASTETPVSAPKNKRIAGLVAGGQAFLNRRAE